MASTVRKLVETCDIRFFETPMGKSLLDEHHPLYGGCYAGANSLDKVREEVESADFVLYVGALKSDFNSGSFSVNIDPKIIVELHSFTTNVGVRLSSQLCVLELTDSTRRTPLPIFDTFYPSSFPPSRRWCRNKAPRPPTATRCRRRRTRATRNRRPSRMERRSSMLGSGRAWESGSKTRVSATATARYSPWGTADVRHHHHRDRHVLVRPDQRRPPLEVDICRADPVGCYRLVRRRLSRSFPCRQGVGRRAQDGIVRGRWILAACRLRLIASQSHAEPADAARDRHDAPTWRAPLPLRAEQ